MLLKHFNQWRSPQFLPLVLGGDEFPAQALSAYICNMPPSPNIIIPTSYYSNTHHTEINISDLTQFLTQMISTTKEKDNLINREYFQLHQPAIENLAMGGTEKYYSAGQREKSAIQFQAKMNVNKRINSSQHKKV